MPSGFVPGCLPVDGRLRRPSEDDPAPSWLSSAPHLAAVGPGTADMAKAMDSEKEEEGLAARGRHPSWWRCALSRPPTPRNGCARIFTILAKHSAGDGGSRVGR